ncbi:hypothetical protein BDZ85DRAFT_258990 [Elsinoe ampelina]|uniref:IBR domain-containing protein n=1 Tax=Elsinoe ampelina TaxID=302913 RepID=A0A6A6GGK4_9PEZI|nr:hypothetical protein BDZ85DRAFT_258990 [Elsinoe ampelina]
MRYAAKLPELQCEDRVYCHVPTCSAWISPINVRGDAATCSACRARTCKHCLSAHHMGDCMNDPHAQALLALSREEGWQRCFACRHMVELVAGCFHIK